MPAEPGRLREVTTYFVRLGSTAFGGPAAHIALMRHDLVERKGWIDDAEYAELIGLANLVPGPNSTEVAMHVGRLRAGTRGLVAAGLAFIAPAFTMLLVLAWLYDRYGTRPGFRSVLAGIAPVVVVLIVQAILQLARTSLRSGSTIAIAVLALGAAVVGVHELAILVVAGAVAWAGWHFGTRASGGADGSGGSGRPGAHGIAWAGPLLAAHHLGAGVGPVMATAGPVMLAPLFLVFLQIGAVLYGSGYVLLAFLQTEFVDHRAWLTQTQLVDAISAGQFTPGPVFSTAAFAGYVIDGWRGGLLGAAGIFLPSFVFVTATHPLVPRLRRSSWARPFLDGVNAAALALMVVVTVRLGLEVLDSWYPAVLFAAGIAALLRFNPNSAWLVLAGLAAGLAYTAVT